MAQHIGLHFTVVMLICLLTSTSCEQYPEQTISVKASELFVVQLHHTNFSIEHHKVKFSASILDMPDLPSWLHCSPAAATHMAFLYGVPPQYHQELQVEVIGRNMQTYDISRRVFNMSITSQPGWRYSVLLKVSNLDLEELLEGDRHLQLLQVVTEDLWTEKEEIQHDVAHTLVGLQLSDGDTYGIEEDVDGEAEDVNGKASDANMLASSSVKEKNKQKKIFNKKSGEVYTYESRNPPVHDNLVLGSHVHSTLTKNLGSEFGKVVLTGLVTATHVGDRLPERPDQKVGVYVSFGSNVPFSRSLTRLEREVSILLNRSPCPHYFKKTSYERYFRSRGFSIDWCSFRMNDLNNTMSSIPPARALPPVDSAHYERRQLSGLAAHLMAAHPSLLPLTDRQHVPRHSYVRDAIETVLLPVAVTVLLVALLTAAMCCNPDASSQSATAFLDELIEGFPSPSLAPCRAMPKDVAAEGGGSPSLKTGAEREGEGEEEEQDYHTLRSRRSRHRSLSQDGGSTGYDADNGYDTGELDNSNDNGTGGGGGSDGGSSSYGGVAASGGEGSPAVSVRRQASTPRRFEDYATLTRPAPPPYARGGSANPRDD